MQRDRGEARRGRLRLQHLWVCCARSSVVPRTSRSHHWPTSRRQPAALRQAHADASSHSLPRGEAGRFCGCAPTILVLGLSHPAHATPLAKPGAPRRRNARRPPRRPPRRGARPSPRRPRRPRASASAAGGVTREVLTGPQRSKLDPSSDRDFYSFPRMVGGKRLRLSKPYAWIDG